MTWACRTFVLFLFVFLPPSANHETSIRDREPNICAWTIDQAIRWHEVQLERLTCILISVDPHDSASLASYSTLSDDDGWEIISTNCCSTPLLMIVSSFGNKTTVIVTNFFHGFSLTYPGCFHVRTIDKVSIFFLPASNKSCTTCLRVNVKVFQVR